MRKSSQFSLSQRILPPEKGPGLLGPKAAACLRARSASAWRPRPRRARPRLYQAAAEEGSLARTSRSTSSAWPKRLTRTRAAPRFTPTWGSRVAS